MRKLTPFVLTVVLSMGGTATLVRAAGGGDDVTMRTTSGSASRILGDGLSLSGCNTSPDNAAEWTRFAKCTTANFTKVQKWARTLDACMTVFKVENRDDDAYMADGVDPPVVAGEGLSFAAVDALEFDYFMGWKERDSCPVA